MRAGSASKGANEGSKGAGSWRYEQRSGGEPGKMAQATVAERVVFSQDDKGKSCSMGGQSSLEEREKFEKGRHDVKSDMHVVNYQSRWDNNEAEKHEFSKSMGSSSLQKPTKEITKVELVKELLKTDEMELPLMGRSLKPNNEELELTNPPKPMPNKENSNPPKPMLNKENEESGTVLIGPSKRKKGLGKVNIKKSTREIGKAQSTGMNTQVISVGKKRREDTEELVASEGRLSKKSSDGEGKEAIFFCDETAVAARQHCREQ